MGREVQTQSFSDMGQLFVDVPAGRPQVGCRALTQNSGRGYQLRSRSPARSSRGNRDRLKRRSKPSRRTSATIRRTHSVPLLKRRSGWGGKSNSANAAEILSEKLFR